MCVWSFEWGGGFKIRRRVVWFPLSSVEVLGKFLIPHVHSAVLITYWINKKELDDYVSELKQFIWTSSLGLIDTSTFSDRPSGEKVSMLTHEYPCKSLRKIDNSDLQSPSVFFMYWCLPWWFASKQKDRSMIIHDTECPYLDQVSLNNTKTCFSM